MVNDATKTQAGGSVCKMTQVTITYKGKSYTGTPEEIKTLKARFDAEYRKAYAKWHDAVQRDLKEYQDNAIKAMAEVNQAYGDAVYYDATSSWGHVDRYDGIIVKRNNKPYVKLPEKVNGRKFIQWHKGFRKVSR